MLPAGFGWSVGDVIKLIEISVNIYQAFKDARKNSPRQFQLLTDELARFHTCLELLRSLLEKHDKILYFGHNQFKATLEECQEFLGKYSALGDRRNSVAKFFRTISWTTEEASTINRLRTAVHGHAHVIELYYHYLNLESTLETKAMNEMIRTNTQETLHEMRLLRKQQVMPLIAEDPERISAQSFSDDGCADGNAASKLEQLAKELDGFSRVLKGEQATWCSQRLDDEATVGSDIAKDEADSIEMDIKVLETVLQEVEYKLERARNGSKLENNQQVVRSVTRRETHDSAVSDMSDSPRSRCESLSPASPTLQARPEVASHRLPPRTTSWDNTSLSLLGGQAPPRRPLSSSPMSSPLPGSSPLMTYIGTGTNTAATTPMFPSPGLEPDPGTRPPSISLPPAIADWSLFCNEAQIICQGWQRPWTCKIRQRRRTTDYGLSLRAERDDGSYLEHELPGSGITVPHTSHTGANPQAMNTVTFKESHNYQLKRVTLHGKRLEREPKYVFQDPADHKAFQELIFGRKLEDSWDITAIESDREKESATQTLRLWRDTHTGIPMILFYANSRKRSPKAYVQEWKTFFKPEPKAAEKKPTLRLESLDQRPDKRANSVSSGGSSSVKSVKSDLSGRASTEKAPYLKRLDIEFGSLEDRDKFVDLWQR